MQLKYPWRTNSGYAKAFVPKVKTLNDVMMMAVMVGEVMVGDVMMVALSLI